LILGAGDTKLGSEAAELIDGHSAIIVDVELAEHATKGELLLGRAGEREKALSHESDQVHNMTFVDLVRSLRVIFTELSADKLLEIVVLWDESGDLPVITFKVGKSDQAILAVVGAREVVKKTLTELLGGETGHEFRACS
jgi:Ni,Fe-hydrogenase maturation factor